MRGLIENTLHMARTFVIMFNKYYGGQTGKGAVDFANDRFKAAYT